MASCLVGAGSEGTPRMGGGTGATVLPSFVKQQQVLRCAQDGWGIVYSVLVGITS